MEPTSNDVVQSGEGQKPETNVDVQKVMEELKAIKATNERLLSESKDWKSKYQSVASEKSNIEKTKLEKEGNFDALLQREREEKASLEQKLKQREKEYLKTQARALLGEIARDAHDISDLMRLEEVKSIQYDEENMTVLKSSVETFVNDIKLKKPWMFGSVKLPSVAEGKPASAPITTKSLSQMSESEKQKTMKESLKSLF
jgi:predicted nuclease with TOPRIM domain